LFACLALGIFVLPRSACGEPKWELDIDAEYAEPEYGFTDIVPPDFVRRYYRTTTTPEGRAWELRGVNLSLWQLAPVPASARYLLNWNFSYEGAITGGSGRTGFIFGNPASSNLMSVEVTARGSLRVVMWGKQFGDNQGRVVFSRRVAVNPSSVKIDARYDIRSATMTCRVDDGEEILIEFRKIVPSAPITIRGAGYFSAVPEADRGVRVSRYWRDVNFDINLSPRLAKTLHKGLLVNAE